MLVLSALSLLSTAYAEDPGPGPGGGAEARKDDAGQKHDGDRCGMGAGCCDPDKPVLKAAGICVAPVAMVQLWGTVWDQDQNEQADATGWGDPEDDPGVKLKRLELGFEGGGLEGKIDYEIVFGVTAPYDGFAAEETEAGVKYANIGYHPTDWFDLSAGRMKVPFSREALMSSRNLTFTERGFTAEHIAAPTSLGASFAVHKWGLKLTAGAYNSGGNLFGDDGMGKNFGGRLEYKLGKGGVYDTWAPDADFALGVGASGFYDMGLAATTTGVGGDLLVKVAHVSLLADAGMSTIGPGDTTVVNPEVLAETQRMALTGQLSYSIWKLEPAIRYTAMTDSTVGDYAQLQGGLVLHAWKDRARIGGAYVHRFEGEGATEVANDTVRLWAQVGI